MMLKNLFDFKVSKQMKLAKIIMLVGIIAAVVITAVGLVEIMDVAAMKTALGVSKLVAGDIFLFVLKKYLIWALLIIAAAMAAFYTIRYKENKAAA